MRGTLAELLPEPVALTVAGRTDAGVHARGQVASHPGPPAPAGALNALLPPDVRVLASEAAPDGFDARRDALARTYRYRVVTVASVFESNRALHWRYPCERGLLDECAALLPGRHDFTAFTRTQTSHTRFEREVLMAEWRESEGGALELWIEAESFLRHMVRILVGTMLGVAAGRMQVPEFARLLTGAHRSQAGDTAAPHGLYLEAVRY